MRPYSRRGDPALAARLRREQSGEVLFDAFSRGRYSTDASIYQIEPVGVVVPRTEDDVVATVAVAAEEGVPLLPRGGGTSQCGQAVGEAVVMDFSKHLAAELALDAEGLAVTVQPGMVLEQLNRRLQSRGLFFPVDPSTASRATLGGMAGNNSCGARSIRYGNMVHNVLAIDAVTAAGEVLQFAEVPRDPARLEGPPRYRALVERLRGIAAREAGELAARFPKLLRRVGGYNLDSLCDDAAPGGPNMARLLVGSEGTLGVFTRLRLRLQRLPGHRVLGVCAFPTFHAAMAATRGIVDLDPSAVELVDRTLIELARGNPAYRGAVERFVPGRPDAVLLVEFAGEERAPLLRRLRELDALMGELGFPGGLIEALDPGFQAEIWEVRKAGLNIVMSMKGDGKPVSFIEDCAVPLEDLPEYTRRLNEVFARHGTRGTWYAHASVGCLHVRPILNMKDDADVRRMRAIAEEAFAMVREYKGSHSGEHGDGLVRSEFHEAMFGERLTRAFAEVKDAFDPRGLFNPGKIVRAPRMDDRRLFRYRPGYRALPLQTALDWSEWGGFPAAVEMCNNNGACRKTQPGVMCPSYRVTRDEQHLTRGRANTLRLALSGQLGPGALVSEEMYGTMDLCVGCKGCRRECPTGVDMTRMKVEFLHHYRRQHGLCARDRLVAWLPRYAPWAARLSPLANLRNRVPALRAAGERLLGLSGRRSLPAWRRDPFRPPARAGRGDGVSRDESRRRVVLFADTFNTWFEPENARAACRVLEAGGYEVVHPDTGDGGRPPCCGRTFLAAGLVDEARAEARRTLRALDPWLDEDTAVVGLEPSCLLSFRDEFAALLPGADSDRLARRALLFEEFLAGEQRTGRLRLPLTAIGGRRRALLHGHCHQKAFGAMDAVESVLRLVPGLEVETVPSGCCGMAGAFGYEARHFDLSLRMAELDLLPAVRAADPGTLVVADGTSCRHQIRDGAGRRAVHVARVLEMALHDSSAGRMQTSV